jgi:hypothetical protein
LAAAALLFSLISARADDGALIGRWYAALLVADRTELSDLLADDVRINSTISASYRPSRNSSPPSTTGRAQSPGLKSGIGSRRPKAASPRSLPAMISPTTTC